MPSIANRENRYTILSPKTPMLCQTKGDGYWSHTIPTTVSISKIELEVGKAYVDLYNYRPFLPIYMKAYFPKKSWNTEKQGLIYTDSLWIKNFREQFKVRFPAMAWMAGKIDYTEQGMQGSNYVSMNAHLDTMTQLKRFDKSLEAMPETKWQDSRNEEQ